MVYRLSEKEIYFPDPRVVEVEESGLIAIGGDLSVDRLIFAYDLGIFPWFSFRLSEILWYCPMRRFVIFPDEIHVSHSMRTLLRKECYRITYNEAFSDVIEQCSKVDGRYENACAWLGEDMIKAYTKLHRMGHADSVEVWEGERLVGGLYGVVTSHIFCGESMFSLVPNGSKMALIYLAQHLKENGFDVIDCQFETPHLKSMGGRYISYQEYMTFNWNDFF